MRNSRDSSHMDILIMLVYHRQRECQFQMVAESKGVGITEHIENRRAFQHPHATHQ